jgi:hypothetical protein
MAHVASPPPTVGAVVAALLVVAVAGCVNRPGPATRAFARVEAAPSLAPATLPEAPSTAGRDPEDLAPVHERELRDAFAAAPEDDRPAQELAAFLAADERHAEALVVVDLALQRGGSEALQIVRAGLLRDLGQRHAALATLEALRAAGADLHPGLWLELAELAWLEGENESARRLVAELREDPAHAAWLRDAGAEAQRLLAAIAAGDGVLRMRVRDLLGNLRGAPLASERIAALERLLDESGLDPTAYDAVAENALAIALHDVSPAVRASAVRGAPERNGLAADACAVGLADGAALVRVVASERAAAVLAADALPALTAALAVETDASAFAALHAAVRRLLPALAPLPAGAAADSEGRAQAVAVVQSRLSQPANEP